MILLDTHALVWWLADPAQLPAPLRRQLDLRVETGERVLASAISAWEIAMLVDRGRLELTMSPAAWVAKATALPFVEFVPVDPEIAVASVTLPAFPHRDPADRIIAATALRAGAILATADERMRGYAPLRTLWN
ncbi:MAG TPA: type II toxin-antitoxin system VapC family toxin [Gemmatimonadales bacterium]